MPRFIKVTAVRDDMRLQPQLYLSVRRIKSFEHAGVGLGASHAEESNPHKIKKIEYIQEHAHTIIQLTSNSVMMVVETPEEIHRLVNAAYL